jgi:hypothetical protein
MNPIVLPWLAEIGIIFWRSLTGTHFTFGASKQAKDASGKSVGPNLPGGLSTVSGTKRLPLPSEILPSFLIFGIYAAIAEKDARVGQLLAWGTVLATGILMFSVGSQQQPTTPGSFPPGQSGPFTSPTPSGPNYPTGAQTPGVFPPGNYGPFTR